MDKIYRVNTIIDAFRKRDYYNAKLLMLSVESEYVLKTVTLCTCTVGTEADFVVCSQLQRYRWKMNKMLEYSYINSLKVH